MYVPSHAGQALFGLFSLVWVVYETYNNIRTWPNGARNRDQLSRYVIVGTVALAFWLALLATAVHRLDLVVARALVFYVGLALMALGLVFRAVAIWQLGGYFTPEVTIQPGQRLVVGGLYRWLRHPSYTGTFITILGFGLALTNWLSLLIVLVLPGLAYAFRIRVEEAALREAFGDDYQAYMRRTKRLIPFIF